MFLSSSLLEEIFVREEILILKMMKKERLKTSFNFVYVDSNSSILIVLLLQVIFVYYVQF